VAADSESGARPAVDLIAALKSAVLFALIAFGLASLLIGVRTEGGPTGALVFTPRPFAVAVIVVGSGSHGTRFQAALGPTRLAPRASGEATMTRTSSGWRIHLDATGLPRLADGRFYEAWLRSPAGVLVPIGTFNEGRNVTLWAGVSPEAFRTFTVTREQADGAQASSGEKVLVGAVSTDG